jgi:2-polyprenyl-3-methyl-5-hydroxy-6-metoxy-1,4-benzoquinol methylase
MKECPSDAEAVRKLFTDTSREYAGLFLSRKTGKNFIFRQRLALATAAARETSGQVMDCATGSGEIIASILATRKFEGATVLDLSPKMLELASDQVKKEISVEQAAAVEFVCNDVFRFAGENSHRKYDLIVCLGLIAHTGRLPELLRLLRKLLARDGIILLQTTLAEHPGARVERFFSAERYFRKHGYRINYFRQQDIAAACAAAGLSIAGCRRYGLGIPFGDRLWSWGNYQLERIFQRWADTHGAEAIYRLKADAIRE